MEKFEKADVVAHQIALSALMQTLYAALVQAASKPEFRRMMAALETATVANLDKFATGAPADTETYVSEAASGYVSRFFASIQAPDDRP